jgi:hypothetical protein
MTNLPYGRLLFAPSRGSTNYETRRVVLVSSLCSCLIFASGFLEVKFISLGIHEGLSATVVFEPESTVKTEPPERDRQVITVEN